MNRFIEALKKRGEQGYYPVIPDIKCRSPKEGDLLQGRDPVEVAMALAVAGAPVLSVVTESVHFGGSLRLLSDIVRETGLPVLRKDFIKEKEDLYQTKEAGGSAILLICSMLEEYLLKEFYQEALQIGLEPLVEAHNREELLLAETLGARLVGINNRNILALEKDEGTVSSTQQLAAHKPPGSFLISESGILTEGDVHLARSAGADAVLVGTALWQASDMAATYQAFSRL